MVANVQVNQEDPDAYVVELRTPQTYTPKVNMIRVINHIDTHKGLFHDGKHLKFPTVSHPRGPYDDWMMGGYRS